MKQGILLLVLSFTTVYTEALLQGICKSLDPGDKNTNIREQCLKQIRAVCDHHSLLFQFYDASSKYPYVGLNYTTGLDFGNFDYCLSIQSTVNDLEIRGKYCPFCIPVPKVKIDQTEGFEHLRDQIVNSYIAVNSGNTPNNNSLKLSTNDLYILSICIPDACTPYEIIEYIAEKFIPLPAKNETSDKCITKDTGKELTGGDIAVTVFLVVILALIIISTSYDVFLHYRGREATHLIQKAFSLFYNGKKLVGISKNPDQIECLNGLRFFSMAWVIAGHGFAAWQTIPITNAPAVDKWKNSLYSQYIQSAPVAVDTFFFLSGLLLTYGYLKGAKNKPLGQHLMGVPFMYLHRYLRLTPAVGAMYIVLVTVFKHIGSGPLWKTVIDTLVPPCTDGWWKFFLYVQNYAHNDIKNGTDTDMCLTHTWYLAADMQMFILAPLVIIPMTILIKHHYKMVMGGLTALTVVCVIFPIAIRLAITDIKNVYDTHSRLCDYLIGIITGALLRTYQEKKFPFSKVINFILWVIALGAMIAILLVYHWALVYADQTGNTLFYGLYRPIWCAGLGWLVFSCHFGHGGFVNWLLTRPTLQIGARLSYCMYLLHALVVAYIVGTVRDKWYFDDYHVYYYWCGHFITTLWLSTVWTLAFEAPMISIDRLIFQGIDKLMGKGKPERKPNQQTQ